jgi:transposase
MQIMANQRIQMFQLKRIIELRVGNKSKHQIAQLLGISRNTLKSYLRQLLSHQSDLSVYLTWSEEQLIALLRTPLEQAQSDDGKISHAALYALFPQYANELSRVGVSRMTLWTEYCLANPTGVKYRQFCSLFERWQSTQKVTMHLEHKAGDKLFVDFAGDKLHLTDSETGEQIPLDFFVAILPCSQLTYAQCVMSQRKEDFILALSNALSYLGGVPQAVVPDNLKSAVTKADRYEPQINETLADFASHYGTCIFPARSRKPKDKALVENAVHILYGRIYAPLRNRIFHSLTDINLAISELLEGHNNALQKEKGCTRRERFIELEQAALMPLPPQHYLLRKFSLSKVHPNGHATLKEDKHYYSVPYRLVGKEVKLIYTHEMVEIYYNHQRVASHLRMIAKGRYTTLKEHLHPNHQWISGWSPIFFEEQADKIGGNTRLAIDQILCNTAYPEQAYRSCAGVLALAKSYTAVRLENACGRALYYNFVSATLIKSILERALDRLDLHDQDTLTTTQPAECRPIIPLHDNIRGAEIYQ